jgi:hypothetical protein
LINADDFLEGELLPIGQANHDKYMAAKQMTRYGGPPGGMPSLGTKVNSKKVPLPAD